MRNHGEVIPRNALGLLTSPSSKCQSPARPKRLTRAILQNPAGPTTLFHTVLHSLPVMAYARKNCHTPPKATDGGSQRPGPSLFVLSRFCHHFVGPMQTASWPQGKFTASSGDDRSAWCQHREGPGVIWLGRDLGGGGWGPGGERTSEEGVSLSGGRCNGITLLPISPATSQDKDQGLSSVDKHPLASSRLSPWCHFSRMWVCSACNIPGLLKPVPGRAEVLILRRRT